MSLAVVKEELTASLPAPIAASGTPVVRDVPSSVSNEIDDDPSTVAAVCSGSIAAQVEIGTGGDWVAQTIGRLTVPAAQPEVFTRDDIANIALAEVHIDAHARSLVTDVVEQVLTELLGLIRRYAIDNFVQISKIEVTAFVDPEEDTKEIVVTQWIRARPSFALDYWDKFGVAMTQWISRLPNYLQEIAYDRISVAVESDEA